ncbi:DUF4435 domain-containing protein [Providencia sp. PROV091]|uniref:DUF4435 domain-containing protein n=1 Tax=Providencia sp. PROV091 TaxID=2949807 RepID=UPI00234B3D76|nr:DUF4435 domain-containing protein [Providencia sp. PROV091]
MDILSDMKMSRDATAALKQELLIAKTYCDSVFIFEGKTDFGVYETWLARVNYNLTYTHIAAKSKTQAIKLYDDLYLINDSALEYTKFIVDHDYDLNNTTNSHILTLNAYSIENYLVSERILESILKDEFEIKADKIELIFDIKNQFNQDLDLFIDGIRMISKPLFIKHNTLGSCQFYQNIKEFFIIKYNSISYSIDFMDKVINIDDIEHDKVSEMSLLYDSLPDNKAIRGKYLMEFFREWLESLREFIKNEKQVNKRYKGIAVNFDARKFSLRRFATISYLPTEFSNFFSEN